jgi:predicted ArsR family transcriptional regulator
MNQQMQQLVALLADDGPARILEALQREALAVPQLVRETGASERTVVYALELLLAHGVVAWEAGRRGAPGRPSRVWRIAAEKELAAFDRACEELRGALLRLGLEEVEEGERRGRGGKRR